MNEKQKPLPRNLASKLVRFAPRLVIQKVIKMSSRKVVQDAIHVNPLLLQFR